MVWRIGELGVLAAAVLVAREGGSQDSVLLREEVLSGLNACRDGNVLLVHSTCSHSPCGGTTSLLQCSHSALDLFHLHLGALVPHAQLTRVSLLLECSVRHMLQLGSQLHYAPLGMDAPPSPPERATPLSPMWRQRALPTSARLRLAPWHSARDSSPSDATATPAHRARRPGPLRAL